MPFDLCRIGQLLRQTREEKGLSFEEVSEVLFIRKRVIGAIEAGDWGSLPHPVYVKGYVMQYAAFLNMADLLEPNAAMGEEESQAPGPDGLKKNGIFSRWGLGKKKVQIHRPVSAPWSVIDQL
jgi:transcriptional regulator with XRE-family HTH domain